MSPMVKLATSPVTKRWPSLNPGGLKIFFRLGLFVTLTALFLVLTVPRGTPEYVVSVLSLFIGLALLGLILLVHWWSSR